MKSIPCLSMVPLNVLRQTTFHWDFGDGTTGLGLKNTHRYTRPGSYLVKIVSNYGGSQPQLIESALVQVLPYEGYQLPNAVIAVSGDQSPDVVLPFSNPVLFDATRSTASSKIVSYTWDFNDDTSSNQPVIQHRYDQHTNWQMAFVILRVKDELGFFSDNYVEIINQDVQGQGVMPPSYGQSNISASQPSSLSNPSTNQSFIGRIVSQINILSRNLIDSVLDAKTGSLLALAFLLVFLAGGLHALVPGHGKSIMAVFLCGKKGSGLNDVLLLASSITFTHTIVIFLLGFVFLFVDQQHSLQNALPYFEKIGALIVAILAFNLIRNGWHNLRGHGDHEHEHSHDHSDQHAHPHPHPHPHIHESSPSGPAVGNGRKSVLFAGFAGGIVPCSDAFALLLLLVSAGKVLLGIVFVLVFSAGLACTIVLLGLILVTGKRSFDLEGKLGRAADTYAPLVSGILLLAIAVRLLL